MAQWIVNWTGPMDYGSGRAHGYGFTVQKTGTAESIAFVYKTHAEADRAEAAVREAVRTAADISIG